MTEEVWKDVPGYEGRYQVSTLGRVKSLPFMQRFLSTRGGEFFRQTKERILKPMQINSGYHVVNFSVDNIRKARTVHRIVAEAFLEGEGEVNHKNGIKTDNRLVNLEFVTRTENHLHAVSLGLNPTAQRVRATDVETGETRFFDSLSQAAVHFKGAANACSSLSRVLKKGRVELWGQRWERV